MRVRLPPLPQRNKLLRNLNAAGTFKFLKEIYYVPPNMSYYYTYILESLKDKSLYIGYTSNLKNRFQSHNSGKNKATKPHIPYKLIHFEGFLNRVDAKRREEYLKSGWGIKSIKTMLEKYLKTI